jgi:hypothetical protein
MLPKLTPLQYLVLQLLFVGPQMGEQLRQMLRSLGVRQSRTAFSRMMMRLIVANYVSPHPPCQQVLNRKERMFFPHEKRFG